jgi:hypothetical protein
MSRRGCHVPARVLRVFTGYLEEPTRCLLGFLNNPVELFCSRSSGAVPVSLQIYGAIVRDLSARRIAWGILAIAGACDTEEMTSRKNAWPASSGLSSYVKRITSAVA